MSTCHVELVTQEVALLSTFSVGVCTLKAACLMRDSVWTLKWICSRRRSACWESVASFRDFSLSRGLSDQLATWHEHLVSQWFRLWIEALLLEITHLESKLSDQDEESSLAWSVWGMKTQLSLQLSSGWGEGSWNEWSQRHWSSCLLASLLIKRTEVILSSPSCRNGR